MTQPEKVTGKFLWKSSVLFFLLITGAYLQHSSKETMLNNQLPQQASLEVTETEATADNSATHAVYLHKSTTH